MPGDSFLPFRCLTGAALLTTGCLSVAAFAQEAPLPAAEPVVRETAATPAGAGALAPEGTLPSQEESVQLGEIVVTASGFQQNVADAPASISIISQEELRKGQFTDLTDALRRVQGVAVIGNANEQDISIRGLPGDYTLILVDGVRQGTRDSRPNGSAGVEQRLIPPLEAIERIEVLRGPASTLYGSDAVGGVINIITKQGGDVPTASVTLEQVLQEDRDFGDSTLGRLYGSVPLVADRLGLQFWGSAYGRGEDQILSGHAGREDYEIAGRLSFTPNESNTFTLEAGATRLKNRYNPGESLDPTSLTSHQYNEREYVRATQQGDFGWGSTIFSVLSEWGERTSFAQIEAGGPRIENPRSPMINNIVLDGRAIAPFTFHGDHTFTIGAQYTDARLTDQNPGRLTGEDEKFSAYQYALFAEDEWWVTASFALTAGLRMDYHEIYETHFSPRLYGVYNLSETVTLKGGVSTGFRAPDIRSITPGYAYTTGGGGCFYGPASELPEGLNPCGVILANPDLEPETSVNYEAAVLYDNFSNFSAGATLFHTTLKDRISNEQVFNADGTNARWADDPNYVVWRNYNLDEAVIQGLELTASYDPIDTLRLSANYTFTDSEQKTGAYAGLPLNRTPKHAGNLRIDWQTPIPELSAYASGYYLGEQINAGTRIGESGSPIYNGLGEVIGRKYDGYFTGDVGATYLLTDAVTLNAGIFNVTSTEGAPEEFNDVVEGRRYWFSVNAAF